jgi:hypothetical protein
MPDRAAWGKCQFGSSKGSNMMKRLKLLACAICLATAPAQVFAGTVTGPVNGIHVRSGPTGSVNDTLVFVTIGAAATGRLGCAAATLYWMISDAKSEAGKQQLSLLMTAKALGKNVTVTGTNTCTRWQDGEDIQEIMWGF